ncbi:RloB family protein [Methanogenium marinum]|uniref:RloB family protein n=1 Tax=Methanogenium marinum TaxID=348610 RepID=A0A9Q4PYE1_9EURY|nr:RloB family protein [Methanogenium marinum]MDE4907752.1 RloB family protein [Methanogenium marinum]
MGRVRKSKNIPLRPLVVIFSDGQTEINYFRCKKLDLNENRNIKIEPVHANQKSAAGIVTYAKRYLQKKGWTIKQNDRIFCVIDMDCAADLDIKKALKEKPGKMDLIISNPDFEFWFLLHYDYHQGSLQNKEPIKKLREYERGYEKPNVERIYPSLKSREMNAISHAERLRQFHENEGVEDLYGVSVNPYTNVDKLVSYINAI